MNLAPSTFVYLSCSIMLHSNTVQDFPIYKKKAEFMINLKMKAQYHFTITTASITITNI